MPKAGMPFTLLTLPDEIKLQVIRYLDRRHDLYSLSLTCRTFEDVTMNALYRNIEVAVPQSKTSRTNIEALPWFRPHVVEQLQELTIVNGYVGTQDPVLSRSRRSKTETVPEYVEDIIGRIPAGQLSSFAFLHHSPLSLHTLDLLTAAQSKKLTCLRFYELEVCWQIGIRVPQQLDTLECRSIHDGEAMGKLVYANRHTLQTLRLGQEKELVENYRRSRIGFLDHISQPLDSFTAVMTLQQMPNLRDVALYGLDVSSLVPRSIPEAMFFCQIEKLTLESCVGSADLLENLAGIFHYSQVTTDIPQQTPRLKSFLFRHEAPTTPLKDSLFRFLASFRTLTTLSVLLENATFLERPSAIINEHGPTLHTLVLESRIQPREHLGLDTSRPFGVGGYSQELWEASIEDICRLCPNLVELGMGFPWDDEMVRLRKTHLPHLQHLRTIHVRNFPESTVLSQLGDYTIKEYANKFVDWVFPGLVGGKRPSLEHLAIGPTLYEARWRTNPTRKQPPEYLRTHHFCLDWAKTRFGRWSPMVTGVGEKSMEEIKGANPLGGVFEQVWLR